MNNLKNMTMKQLETAVTGNRVLLRTTNDLALKRRLIAENHKMMTEMDKRYEAAEKGARK